MKTGYRSLTQFVLLIAAICTLILIARPLLVQAGPDLPPRDPPPTNNPPPGGDSQNDDDDDGRSAPLGAYIELQTQPLPVGAWSTVQWQDSVGGWQNVEGWHGALGSSGYQLWWVEAKDFGKGPFRWIVIQGNGGPIIGTSDAFNLPAGAGERVKVIVSLNGT